MRRKRRAGAGEGAIALTKILRKHAVRSIPSIQLVFIDGLRLVGYHPPPPLYHKALDLEVNTCEKIPAPTMEGACKGEPNVIKRLLIF